MTTSKKSVAALVLAATVAAAMAFAASTTFTSDAHAFTLSSTFVAT